MQEIPINEIKIFFSKKIVRSHETNGVHINTNNSILTKSGV